MVRKLGALKAAYEKYKTEAAAFAGPAVIEVFGEKPFAPVNKKEALKLDERQQKLSVKYDSESGRLVNEYIKGEDVVLRLLPIRFLRLQIRLMNTERYLQKRSESILLIMTNISVYSRA